MKQWTDEECDALRLKTIDGFGTVRGNEHALIHAAVAEARREQRERGTWSAEPRRRA